VASLILPPKEGFMYKFFAAALAVSLASTPAVATDLVLGSGWQIDTLFEAGQPTALSDWTFTIANGAHFSLTDCCLGGDVWTLSGDIVGSSVIGAGANDLRADGSPAGDEWLNPSLGKFSRFLSAGTYNFTITGDGAAGLSAQLAIRLDSSIPEPGTWAMLIAGFGLTGAVSRRRRMVTAAS
jgi:hypothetical protein